jgi:hypothetical protein
MKVNPKMMLHSLTTMLLLFPWLVMVRMTTQTAVMMVPQGATAFGWNPTVSTHHRPQSSSSRLEMVTFPMFETQERDGQRTKRMMPTRPKPSSYQGLDGVHHLFTAEHHKYV